tara:strand:- start:947 stop:1081 length:135 start_codon:yes stop_codon:yes gene_type:complete
MQAVLSDDDKEMSNTMSRRYQSVRDGQLGVGKGNILNNYQQLVV